MSDFVVGKEDCDIQEVVDTLFLTSATSGLIDNWKTIARVLKVPNVTVKKLEDKKKNDDSIQEIWYLMLEAWKGLKGADAKLSVLIQTLENPSYSTKDAADKLSAKYVISTGADAASNPGGINLGPDKYEIHITKNLPQLIRHTIVNTTLITTLQSCGLFSDDDVNALDAISNAAEKARTFYTIIKTKTNFYPHLRAALEAGSQYGAVATLKTI